jgi:hypothetical protein
MSGGESRISVRALESAADQCFAVLPISQIPSIPACMFHTARILPLETILKLPTPNRWAEEFAEHEARESKKTYRAGLGGPAAERDRGYHAQWTTGDIMVGWAGHRGYGEPI